MTDFLFLLTINAPVDPFFSKKTQLKPTHTHTLHITIGLTVLPLCYLRYEGRSVPVAGDEDYERPVIWVHKDTSCLSTGGVKCRGAAPVGALDTAALHLPLHPFPAVHTLLPE